MSDDAEHVLVELPRGDSDVLRVTRKVYEGKPFTDVRVYFRGTDGKMHPTKKGTSIRDRELPEVLAALTRVATKIGAQPSRAPLQSRKPPASQRPDTGDFDMAKEDAEGLF